MKHFKLALKVIGLAFLLLVALFSGLQISASIGKESNFYTIGAEFSSPDYYSDIEKQYKDNPDDFRFSRDTPPVYAHRVKTGSGIIIGYRWYSHGDLNTIDDEIYEKMTISLSANSQLSQGKFKISRNVRVISIRGGAAWPTSACIGEVTNGDVSIRKLGGEIEVKVLGHFIPIPNRMSGGYCEEKQMDMTFVAKELNADELSTFQGRPADHPYGETYWYLL